MVELILGIFTSKAKVEAILSNPMIEFIFIILFVTFFVALFVHIALFNRLKNIRNYLKETNRMDIDPLNDFEKQFNERQQSESVRPETFVQEKFSGWRLFGVPVVSLIKIIQMTVSVFIIIGVLGTFIGLTISLSSINTTGEQLVENVAAVLAGIDIAFYTSIVGMGLSLIMTVIIKLLNTEYMLTDIMLKVESNFEGNEEGSIGRLIEVSETINYSILGLQETNEQSLGAIVQAFSGFQEYTTGLQQSAKDLALFNEGLSENLQQFQELFNHMKEVTDGFGASTTKLNKNFDTLFSYFKKVDGKNERMVKAMEHTHENIKEVANAQVNTLAQFETSVEELKEFILSIVETQQSLQDSFQKMNHKSSDLVEKMGEHNKEFKNVFGGNLSSQLAGIVSNLSELSKDFDMLENAIKGLPEALDIINQTQAEYKHLLSDRFDELKEFNRSFNNHLKSHADESRNFEKQLHDASQTYEQMSLKNSQLLSEMNTMISHMNHTSKQQENQIGSHISLLKDALTKHVDVLEGTLGDRLDRVVRSINDSVEMTTEGLNREFKELGRLSEDMQQANFRYMQQILQELSREIQMLNRQLNTVSQQAANRNSNIRLNQNEY
ncbi:MotA/TolQ/ExbB proton channel family protein [Virgibacillus sp. W0181]|uniref:MotA/TolQ/ExbB proton channel family protein n=1 Tax=Virgibacillus sp. W0181 TaxID=3391581 RepID=UPI003F4669B5